VTDQWEGWWEPVDGSPSPRLHGKVEYEPSFDGDGVEIDLLVRDLDVPDGEQVELLLAGAVVLSATVEHGGARERLRSADGHVVPDLARQSVELRHAGTVLARAVLEPD
jgi:hypothetical protein